MPQVRQLVNEAKYGEAAKLISEKVMARPLGQMPYQTVGDLLLAFPEMASVGNYRRELNLDTATASGIIFDVIPAEQNRGWANCLGYRPDGR